MAEPKTLLIRGARQLVTLRGPNRLRRGVECDELGVIEDGAVLIAGGRIVSVGPSARVDRLSQAHGAEEFDAHGAVVMPAFLDPLFGLPRNPERTMRQAALHGTAIFAVHCPLAALRALRELAGVVPVLTDPEMDASEAKRVTERFPIAFTLAETKLPRWSRDGLTVFGPETEQPTEPLIESGAAMGTGYLEKTFSTWNVSTAIGLACRSRRLRVEQAVTLTTANAAWAAGLGEELGTIQVGMRADLNILTLPDYREIPHVLGANIVARRVRAGILVP
ncbi:MAG: amidohydrolase family protein [Acidobacteria bacterium]|nr:amidohydrolase family protein [Acidobacteriota bacterium]